ncbi:2-dehydro-3-deoxy-D-gluconate 5-dehydrogenase [Salinisphaera orenii MK-B5]|uniref:2-dehydro-3-deoxy-D-gluconate 5-dehydrogenase n=1 Tax=Salinisphaera orenii MK-B5 TaxID=856730 RepID=A0A423PIF4_9GAMM|nr:SDR family oxidoreductase [Salinisphaera orenii]ROO25387.1 2-dehydro-3-deoxy-D-gluconate 5-dehydrogenase [Salinisphaera orenii MK-B5]
MTDSPNERFDLTGRVALITGAGGGLGAGFAEALAAAGARTVLCARREGPLEAVAERIRAAGGEAAVIPMDVADSGSVAAGFDAAEAQFGTVDVAVCNAGIAMAGFAMDMPEADWLKTIEVNLNGCWRVAMETGRRLRAAEKSGSVINISSILGHRVAAAVAPYAASKGALEQLTRSLALEWARYGIRVNAIAPGYIATDLNREFFESEPGQKMIKRIPQKRLGDVDDLVGALLLLASDAGRYMTGSTIAVDGGHLQSSL